MLRPLARFADGMLARLVPQTTAAAIDCWFRTFCDGPFCGGSYVRIKRHAVCCPTDRLGHYRCETQKRTCSCYVGG